MKKIAIFGTSGFSKEVLDIAINNGYKNIIFLADENFKSIEIEGFQVKKESTIEKIYHEYDFTIGIGDGKIREKIFNKYPYLNYPNLIHSSVTYGYKTDKNIKKSKGLIIAAGVRLTNSIQTGNFILINLNSTIGHDTVIEDYVSIMPGANISGNVQLSKNCYIGTGATILQGKDEENKLRIGSMSVVGAGAVVTKSVEEKKIVIGSPAKELIRV